jgi:putative toxin-antitoxin system antitoxin component (TIGR02293 family)
MIDADAVIARAIEVFGNSEKAASWLDRPNRVLAGATPRSFLSTPEGREKVLTVLGRIEHGVYS